MKVLRHACGRAARLPLGIPTELYCTCSQVKSSQVKSIRTLNNLDPQPCHDSSVGLFLIAWTLKPGVYRGQQIARPSRPIDRSAVKCRQTNIDCCTAGCAVSGKGSPGKPTLKRTLGGNTERKGLTELIVCCISFSCVMR